MNMEEKGDTQIGIPSAEKLYEILIGARNFHYENFNKWMTYFYIALSGIFVGYCTIVSSAKIPFTKQAELEFTLCLLGFVVSILWYWSSKGYYYWNINFITLVNNYEQNILKIPFEKRVYFVFANKSSQNDYLSPVSGANISTSKVAILFAFLVSSFWGMLLLNGFLGKIICPCNNQAFLLFIEYIISIFIVLGLSILIPNEFLFSKTEEMFDLKLEFPKVDPQK